MKKAGQICLWILGGLLLLFVLAVLVTRCSNEMADNDFVSFMIVEVEKEGEESPLEVLDGWLGELWWNLTASDARKQAYDEAMESYEREKEIAK